MISIIYCINLSTKPFIQTFSWSFIDTNNYLAMTFINTKFPSMSYVSFGLYCFHQSNGVFVITNFYLFMCFIKIFHAAKLWHCSLQHQIQSSKINVDIMSWLKLLIAFACVILSAAEQRTITIDNTQPLLNTNGSILNAHEGVIKRWNNTGLFYWYAMSYELCNESTIVCDQTGGCAHTYDHNISIWSSPDLSSGSWKFEKCIFDTTTPNRPIGVYDRPYLFYNKLTQKYVIWIHNEGYNLSTDYNRTNVVLQSDSHLGPFKVIDPAASVANTTSSGDTYGFQDDDVNQTAYIIYGSSLYIGSSPKIRGIAIDRLTSDYLASSGETSGLLPLPHDIGNTDKICLESPVMFKRNGIYYLIAGLCCCSCKKGSDAMVWTASHPLGPWKYVDDIGGNVADKTSITHSQIAFLSLINQSSGDIMYMISGGRHQQAPDGTFGHDPSIWQPLQFYDNGTVKTLKSLGQIPTFNISLDVDN
eukprot:126856_1